MVAAPTARRALARGLVMQTKAVLTPAAAVETIRAMALMLVIFIPAVPSAIILAMELWPATTSRGILATTHAIPKNRLVIMRG